MLVTANIQVMLENRQIDEDSDESEMYSRAFACAMCCAKAGTLAGFV